MEENSLRLVVPKTELLLVSITVTDIKEHDPTWYQGVTTNKNKTHNTTFYIGELLERCFCTAYKETWVEDEMAVLSLVTAQSLNQSPVRPLGKHIDEKKKNIGNLTEEDSAGRSTNELITRKHSQVIVVWLSNTDEVPLLWENVW